MNLSRTTPKSALGGHAHLLDSGQDLKLLKHLQRGIVDEEREERNVCTLIIKLPNFSAC